MSVLLDRAHTRALMLIVAVSALPACAAEPGNPLADDEVVTTPLHGELDAVPDDAEATTAEVARAARIAFTPCAEDPEFECGQLSVPVDYARPRGAQVALAVVRARATGPRRRGVLFVNPGGPGGSGVDLVIFGKQVFTTLRQDFDIVSFDPRGTARSTPVACTFALPPPPANDSLEAIAAYADQSSRRYARACQQQFGGLATQLGTNNVARDLDVFRAALGEPVVNYLGFSYGTALGSSYATLFPQRVRAMVLDGNVAPTWFSDYLLELDAEGSAGAELALRRVDQLCRESATCALRTRGVIAVFDQLVERLNRDPVAVPDGLISGASVTARTFAALYNEQFGWPFIIQVLARADAGDYSLLPAFPVDDGATITVPSTYAIVCDDSTSRRPGLDYLPIQRGLGAVYPRFGGVNFGTAVTACTAWPAAAPTPLRGLRTRHPVVLIGNDFDSATPMTWSRNMATTLGDRARLVRYQGGGHTIYGSGSACIDGAVNRYLRELTPPAEGLTCPAVSLSFAPSLQRATPPRIADVLQQVAPAPRPFPTRRAQAR